MQQYCLYYIHLGLAALMKTVNHNYTQISPAPKSAESTAEAIFVAARLCSCTLQMFSVIALLHYCSNLE